MARIKYIVLELENNFTQPCFSTATMFDSNYLDNEGTKDYGQSVQSGRPNKRSHGELTVCLMRRILYGTPCPPFETKPSFRPQLIVLKPTLVRTIESENKM